MQLPATAKLEATPATIHRAQATDAEALATLCLEHARYERLPPCPVDHALRLRMLLGQATQPLHVWMAWSGSDAVGYASATVDIATLTGAHFLHLDCLYVREHWRGLGLGRQLLDTVTAYAKERTLMEMQWQTPDWNEDAIRFYRRSGASMLTKQRFILKP